MNRREFIQTSSLFALAGGVPATAVALDKSIQPDNPGQPGGSDPGPVPPAEPSHFGIPKTLAAYWPFDEVQDATTAESVNRTMDAIRGHFSVVQGILGNGLKCDGFTTCISRTSHLPAVHKAIAFEAWIAPQAYPWNWNAIVEQRGRYYFGLDATGHIGLRVMVDKQWRECVSGTGVPFMQWSHIAASFDPGQGITVYINGQEVGQLDVVGHLDPDGADGLFQIGRNIEEIPAAASRKLPASYSFDGIIDELKIYDGTLSASEIQASYQSLRPTTPPAMTWRKLPAMPAGKKEFGAIYTGLKLYPEWDRLWRIDQYPDLLVNFDDAAYKMVFWHGTAYNMNLVTENGRWIGDQSAEAPPEKNGCIEHMSDKQCRYSHVRLIENSRARVVAHWRYAMCDVLYNIGEPNPVTNWGDWTDEYYTIYPDGMAVRHFLIHGPLDDYSITEPATLNNPGEKAEDNVSIRAATLANMDGKSRTYSWETWPSDGGVASAFTNPVPSANIAVVNTRSEYKPVYVYEPGTEIIPYGGGAPSRPWFSKFPTWNHWPVAQIPSDGRDALALDHISSSAILSPAPPMPRRAHDGSLGVLEGRFLMGFTNQPISATFPMAHAWLHPPVLTIVGGDFAFDNYSRDDRAFHLRRLSNRGTKLVFNVQASDKSPLMNPAFVVNGWNANKVSLRLNGELVKEGKDFRVGNIDQAENRNLVVWIRAHLTRPSHFALGPIS